jgi:APA family basic amino acid/polyamine antiporter
MYHGSGAQYAILRDAYGPFLAFLYVFCNATAIGAGAVGIIAFICAQNLVVVAGLEGVSDTAGAALAALLVVGVTLANAAGVRWGSRIQNVTVAAKILILLAVTALAAFAAPALPAAPAPVAGERPALAIGLMSALVPALFAFGGWQSSLWVADVVREPRRNVPRAVVGGVLVVAVVYLLTNWAYLRLLGVHGVATSQALAADAVAAAWPGVGQRAVAAAVAISAFGVLNAQMLAGPRLLYGMAEDGRFFRPFGALGARTGTPVASIALLAGMAILFIFAAGFNGIDRLLNGVVFIDGIFFALTGAALFVLRYKRPDADRPARVPGYPVVPALFVLGEVGVVAGASLSPDKREATYIGVAWIAVAAVLYFVRFREKAG